MTAAELDSIAGLRSLPLLHVGCGTEALPAWLSNCNETRLDIDPKCKPDIVGTMTDLGDIGPFRFVYSSHSLEHLYPHELRMALAEFLRVLDRGGMIVAMVPDLEGVAPTEDVLFESPAGPITGLDLIYGHRRQLEGRPYMAHHNGFTAATLAATLTAAGFINVKVGRVPDYNLSGVASKP